jgi:uncharacterized membrane protein YfcA
MWKQYKKTFVGMQLVICAITGGVLAWRHLWDLAAMFFVTMQIGAVLGAMWGQRLKSKVLRSSDAAAGRGP